MTGTILVTTGGLYDHKMGAVDSCVPAMIQIWTGARGPGNAGNDQHEHAVGVVAQAGGLGGGEGNAAHAVSDKRVPLKTEPRPFLHVLKASPTQYVGAGHEREGPKSVPQMKTLSLPSVGSTS